MVAVCLLTELGNSFQHVHGARANRSPFQILIKTYNIDGIDNYHELLPPLVDLGHQINGALDNVGHVCGLGVLNHCLLLAYSTGQVPFLRPPLQM